MKYITTKDNDLIIFSKGINHSDMARKFGGEIRGAGFVELEVTHTPYGKSYFMDMKPHEDDKKTVVHHLNN